MDLIDTTIFGVKIIALLYVQEVLVSYYIKWVKTSWTYSINKMDLECQKMRIKEQKGTIQRQSKEGTKTIFLLTTVCPRSLGQSI